MRKCLILAAGLAVGLAACSPPAETGLAGRWDVQQIAGAPLGEGVSIWIEFDARGNGVHGFTGCNAFTTTVSSFQTSLAFAPINEQDATCPSPAAAVDEARFKGVLPSVQRYIRRDRSLELLAAASGSEDLIRLRRAD
jgi:heat shock protein HslJ